MNRPDKDKELQDARQSAKAAAEIGGYLPGVTFMAVQAKYMTESQKMFADADGHSIIAIGEPIFTLKKEVVRVKLVVPNGSSRGELIRVLHKFIDMVKSADGKSVLRLNDGSKGQNLALRFPDGSVALCNRCDRVEDVMKELSLKKSLADAAKNKRRTRRGLTSRAK